MQDNSKRQPTIRDQVEAGKLGGYTGEDIRAGFEMARNDVGAVEHDLTQLGKESRHQMLTGKDRERFFEGMTQSEFDILHKAAMHLGDQGMAKLETVMNEANDHFAKMKDE